MVYMCRSLIHATGCMAYGGLVITKVNFYTEHTHIFNPSAISIQYNEQAHEERGFVYKLCLV